MQNSIRGLVGFQNENLEMHKPGQKPHSRSPALSIYTSNSCGETVSRRQVHQDTKTRSVGEERPHRHAYIEKEFFMYIRDSDPSTRKTKGGEGGCALSS